MSGSDLTKDKFPVRINEMLIDRIQDRLDIGAKKYGDSISINDSRDFVEEALEEILDMIVYISCATIQLQYKRHSKNKNNITTQDFTLIMEGLSKVVMDSKEDRDIKKVQRCQQLIDRLTDYANDIINQNNS